MREKLITDITKLALDFWTMNLRNGTFESHLRTFIMNYDKAMNYTHSCESDREQLDCDHQFINAGTLQGQAMKRCLRCGKYTQAN